MPKMMKKQKRLAASHGSSKNQLPNKTTRVKKRFATVGWLLWILFKLADQFGKKQEEEAAGAAHKEQGASDPEAPTEEDDEEMEDEESDQVGGEQQGTDDDEDGGEAEDDEEEEEEGASDPEATTEDDDDKQHGEDDDDKEGVEAGNDEGEAAEDDSDAEGESESESEEESAAAVAAAAVAKTADPDFAQKEQNHLNLARDLMIASAADRKAQNDRERAERREYERLLSKDAIAAVVASHARTRKGRVWDTTPAMGVSTSNLFNCTYVRSITNRGFEKMMSEVLNACLLAESDGHIGAESCDLQFSVVDGFVNKIVSGKVVERFGLHIMTRIALKGIAADDSWPIQPNAFEYDGFIIASKGPMLETFCASAQDMARQAVAEEIDDLPDFVTARASGASGASGAGGGGTKIVGDETVLKNFPLHRFDEEWQKRHMFYMDWSGLAKYIVEQINTDQVRPLDPSKPLLRSSGQATARAALEEVQQMLVGFGIMDSAIESIEGGGSNVNLLLPLQEAEAHDPEGKQAFVSWKNFFEAKGALAVPQGGAGGGGGGARGAEGAGGSGL